jgi:hypothetical protein
MDRSHTVEMRNSKVNFIFHKTYFLNLPRAILRVELFNSPIVRRDCTFTAKMDLRPIVTYLSTKDMNAREIYADMNDTHGADYIGYSTVTSISRKKASRSRCLTWISSQKLNGKFHCEATLGAFEECPFSSPPDCQKILIQ